MLMKLKDLYNFEAEKLLLEVQALEIESTMVRRNICDAFLGFGSHERLEQKYREIASLINFQPKWIAERKALLKEAWSLLKKAKNDVLVER
jgi:NAD(P)H-hydrate repair Nnr-like enzyme with NAD(P)H-hydrate epimerase domain